MNEHPRIEDLRRRLDNDPTPFAFAQLAEQYRRTGAYREAIQTCRAGLLQHPGYHSARVILGRCLLETGDLKAAEIEFARVVRAAPDNLSARRGLTDARERGGAKPQPQGASEPTDALTALEAFQRTIVAYRRRQLGNRSDAAP